MSAPGQAPALELGRSLIVPEHQKSFPGLDDQVKDLPVLLLHYMKRGAR